MTASPARGLWQGRERGRRTTARRRHAPEQVRGEQVDARTDLFALGVMMYEVRAGQHPFRRASAFETLHAVITIDPPDPSTVDGRVPPALAAIVMRLLKKAPEARFQSASDLAWTPQQIASRLPGDCPP